MDKPPPLPTVAPRWKRSAMIAGAVLVAFALGGYLSLLFVGQIDRPQAQALGPIVGTLLVGVVGVFIARWYSRWIATTIKRHVDRRYEVLAVALHHQGIDIATAIRETTGDIQIAPRPIVVQCPHTVEHRTPVPDNVTAFELGRKIGREIRD
jgi:uncharacterized membrane protein